MPISPGSRIGPYEVTSHLGEGGMGVVYRGRDSRLQRDVALKLLLDNFASDPDRMSRFQREAQVLASLNHTHIAQIYGLEQVENSACIVMEFVEGETLADRLKKGPLSHDEALDIARQIVGALAAAHEQGVIHRDLKPANIKITPGGTAKVLDFGLAKALGPAKTSDSSLSAMPTVASGSIVGAIVGTPGYMSPEQARGKEVDARTDIWAFGCVLFEMLTARPAFEGETVTDIVAKIVTSGPNLDLLPKDTPPSLRLLLSSVLNKNPAQRLQHIGDARLFLDGTLAPIAESKDVVPAKSAMPGKLVLAALLVALAVLAVPAVLYFRKAPDQASLMRFDLLLPNNGVPALSPDGEMIAYAIASEGKRMLWVRPVGADVGRTVAGTEDVNGFLWSPDSKKIAFIAQNKLQKVDLAGGSPQLLGSIGPVRGADWNRAGIILMGHSKDNVIVKISDTGGEITPVKKLDEKRQETLQGLPVFLPDGNRFLYVAVAGAKLEESGIYLGSVNGDEVPTRVVALLPSRFNGMAFVEPNHLLYSNDGKLIAQNLSSDGKSVEGDPVTIADDIEGNFSVADHGLMTFRKSPPATRKQLLWFGHDGKPLGQLSTDGNYGNLDFSPSGDRVAVDMIAENNRDIWVIDLQRLVPQRVTFDPGSDWSPVWSPDGTRLMFAASRSGDVVNRILEKSSTGAGMETRVDVGNFSSIPVNWSSDDKYLTYSRMRANGNGYDTWVLPLTGDRTPKAFMESTFDRIQARISPDSKYVAYTTNESGTFQIVVQTFPDPNGGKWQISAEGGVEPKWRRDGKELYYLALDGKLMAVPITGSTPFNAGKPAALFQTSLTVTRNSPTRDRRYDIAPDGRFLMVVPVPGGAPLPNTVLVNWQAMLKK